jgi:hypothetical protein
MKKYGTRVMGLIVGWFTLVLAASALDLFKNQANRIGAAVGLAALAPLVVFVLWFSTSEGFRKFALSLNPRILTYAQTWRLLGIVFVILEARGALPGIFAWPAGYGDIGIGLTAGFVAWKLANSRHRASFILWQLVGIADLVTAVGLGVAAGLISPASTPMVAMTVLPLSLIPTFLVPLFFIFHIICIAQARGWKSTADHARPVATTVAATQSGIRV